MHIAAQVWDVETGFDRELLNMNPEGWIQGVTNERRATRHLERSLAITTPALRPLARCTAVWKGVSGVQEN